MKRKKRYDEYDRIYRMIKKNKKPRKDDYLYNKVKEIKKSNIMNEITINDRGEIQPIPNINRQSNNVYAAGPNGAGKSTSIANWAEQYQKLFPKNKIHVFKRDTEDDLAFDNLKFIDEDLEDMIDDPYELDELSNSLLIFDDTSRIRNKEVNSAVKELMYDALENGRKKKISVCVSNHLVADKNNTKTQLYECDTLIVFPGSSNAQIRYVCGTYVGMSKKQINKLFKLRTRWILISKSYPQYIIYDKGVYIL